MSEFVSLLKTIEPYALGVAFAAMYLAEHIIPQRSGMTDYKHDLQNILVGFFNLALAAGGGYLLQQWLQYAITNDWGLIQLLPEIFWLKTLLGIIIIDLFMYGWHRANHEVKFLWRWHSFHHKDTMLNSTSAVRFHAAELILSYAVRFAVFPLLGFNIASVILHAMVLFPVIVFHHSNIRISEKYDTALRHVFVSPRMHRIHHSKIPAETNSNYGSIFPYWDRLFRSYVSKPAKEIEFGI